MWGRALRSILECQHCFLGVGKAGRLFTLHSPTSFAGSMNTLLFLKPDWEEGSEVTCFNDQRPLCLCQIPRSQESYSLHGGCGLRGPVRGVSHCSLVWIQKHLIITRGWDMEPTPRQTLPPEHSSWKTGAIWLSLSCWLWLCPRLTSDGLTGKVEAGGASDGEVGRGVFPIRWFGGTGLRLCAWISF